VQESILLCTHTLCLGPPPPSSRTLWRNIMPPLRPPPYRNIYHTLLVMAILGIGQHKRPLWQLLSKRLEDSWHSGLLSFTKHRLLERRSPECRGSTRGSGVAIYNTQILALTLPHHEAEFSLMGWVGWFSAKMPLSGLCVPERCGLACCGRPGV